MEDKKLLELAAKAAGIEWECFHEAGIEKYDGDLWNPLIDDGDALQLAVKLHLRIEINKASVVIYWTHDDSEKSLYEYPNHTQGDDYDIVYSGHEEATRRAIVKAASKIGRDMK